MADSKKYNGSTWEHSLRKLTTATEAVENPLYSDGTAITVYTLKGNEEHSGTPSPQNPVMPNGVGELDGGQYKIPILSNQQTTNIYLGSTQTVRQINKLVLTGEEDWNQHPNVAGLFRLNKEGYAKVVDTIICICSHYQGSPTVRLYSEVPDKGTTFYAGATATSNVYYIRDSSFSDVETFKSYLAGQYSNGTPVTIWYVLATPQTAAVNEPLMKIGDYADTLSNAASIPTTEGANSITVDTAVQPSEFTATWTGWHDASVKEKSANYLDENDFGLLEVAADVYRTGTDVGVLPSGKYTLSANKSSSAVQIYRTTKNGSTYNYETISELPYTFTADGVSNQIFRTAGSTETSWADAGYSKVMLNSGETAQTYESYWQ